MPLDELDRALVHALHLDGRAPLALIADVLGTSQQTVARRYRRLREEHGLRVIARPAPRRIGQVEWFVRLRATPDAALKVAHALAARDDTSWVQLTSGGTEIVCVTRAAGAQAPDALLLRQLPRTPRVVAVSAHCLLRTFVGGPVGWPGRATTLTEEQVRRLTPEPAATAGGLVDVSGDAALLAALARDGRATYAELAAGTGQPEPAVRRRVQQLRRDGVLYLDVDLDAAALGFAAQALLWLSVRQPRLAAVAEALAGQREVALVAATTGPTNLLASVLCPDVDALYTYLAETIAAIDGVGHVETAPVIRTLKRAA
ncbi:DNA-binding transcriptional regulator, Lrp family [Amycolatopsis sacchari]|uniref:DNA-binding transcriptional regulator, Lrp family n=1 Tax=Amycolatopsis sacchari TaxID=115433 RepID=A0A1I3KP06_9PSEU|nr:Lrp/AsnC family transcriptional regulator [Amycolatopsis sacchari]SFI74206.1 DNA-binding transcriptional regulator, Lrp family [Amycolatopsis sacchari]